MKDKIYLIYRVYSRQERPDDYKSSPLYAWSYDRDIVKIFMKQRDRKKYHAKSLYDDEVDNIHKDPENQLDIAPLVSAQTGDIIHIIMTAKEVTELHAKIPKIRRDKAMLSDTIPEDIDLKLLTDIFLAINDRYLFALIAIGFWPKEADVLYDSVEEPEYCGIDEQCIIKDLPLSVEAFIKVFRNDM